MKKIWSGNVLGVSLGGSPESLGSACEQFQRPHAFLDSFALYLLAISSQSAVESDRVAERVTHAGDTASANRKRACRRDRGLDQ
jgi:hypothetical protein